LLGGYENYCERPRDFENSAHGILTWSQFEIYYQSGSSTTEATLKASGEPIIPAFAELLRIFDPQAKSAAEALQVCLHVLSNDVNC